MATLTINPLTFNSKTNEVIIDKEIINWKKQKATLTKKKNISVIDYLNQNYGNLIIKDPSLFSSIDIEKLLASVENEKNSYLENKVFMKKAR